NSRLKLIAGLLGIGFDDLRRRELARKRQRRQICSLACVAATVAMAAIYVGLADNDINVPKSTEIRRALDRHSLTIFRPIASHDEIVRKGSAVRKQLRSRLVGAVREGKVNSDSDSDYDIWTLAQIAAAIYRDPDASNDDIRWLTPLLDQIFQKDFLFMSNGEPIGGTRAEPRQGGATLLWIMALSPPLSGKNEEKEKERAKLS